MTTSTLTEYTPGRTGLIATFELLLRKNYAVNVMLDDDAQQLPALKNFLAISIAGLGLFGLTVGLSAQVVGIERFYLGGDSLPALWLPLAMIASFLGALLVCLPTFFFYTQLAGIDASLRLVTAHALRTQALSAVYLLAATPVFLATILTPAFLGTFHDSAIVFGLALPFLVGLFAKSTLFRGFEHIRKTCQETHERKGNVSFRLLTLWGAAYTMVAPVALWRFMQAFGA